MKVRHAFLKEHQDWQRVIVSQPFGGAGSFARHGIKPVG